MRSILLAAFLLCLISSVPCRADDNSALINEALDKVVNLNLDGVMPQVMKKITADTSVPIDIPPHVYDLLPWGVQTKITATIKNQTVRQALTAITRRLGLNWELQEQAVKLVPRPPLERIGRRATLEELETLDLLDEPLLAQAPPAGQPATVDWVIKAVDQKLADLKSPLKIEFRPGNNVKADQTVNLPRNATLNDALKEIGKQTDLTWYPWTKFIVILPKEDQIGRQLDHTITKRFVAEDIALVLGQLSQTAGVEFDFEAGSLQRVPSEFRRITLTLDNARVKEALDDIRGVTGLDYVVKPTGVHLWNQNVAAPTTMPAPIVATLQLDNGMVLFLRANEVPPDILEYAEHKKLQEFKRLRQQMKDEQFVPTPATGPTTRPAQ